MTSEAKFKIGDKVQQHATHPDRTYVGFVERVVFPNRDEFAAPEYHVRWHRGYASWEAETDIEAA